MITTALVAATIAAATFTAHASFEEPAPNYAATMTSPFADDPTAAPRLVARRRARPIRVGLVEKAGMMTADRREIVRAACARWADATRGTELGLRFVFVPYRGPGDAEIAFEYRSLSETGTLRGLTTESGGYATIELAVEDARGRALPSAEILRVATHEVGHALGIWGHSPDPRDVMSLSAAGSTTETVETTGGVTVADANTLRIAYRRTPLP